MAALRVELLARGARAAVEMVLLPKAAMLPQTRAAVAAVVALATAAAMVAPAWSFCLFQHHSIPAPQPAHQQ